MQDTTTKKTPLVRSIFSTQGRSGRGPIMHEMALMRNVVDTVLDFAEQIHATEVKTIHLTIGFNRDIVEKYLDSMFAFLARGTIAEHAELIVLRTPCMVKCNQCGRVFHIDVYDSTTWICPQCKAARDYKLHSGMEFVINNIEVTLPQMAG